MADGANWDLKEEEGGGGGMDRVCTFVRQMLLCDCCLANASFFQGDLKLDWTVIENHTYPTSQDKLSRKETGSP